MRLVRRAARPEAERRSWQSWALPVIGVLSLAVIWELGSLVIRLTSDHPDTIWPSLEYVWTDALPGIGAVGQANSALGDQQGLAPGYGAAFEVLWRESLVTIRRVLVGSAIGVVIGVGLGFAVALIPYVRRFLYPPVNVLRTFPLLALTLLFLIWFGGKEVGVYSFIAFGVSTMLFVNTVSAVRNVPVIHVRYARTLGASGPRVFRTVIVPAVMPELMSGLQVALGLAWAMALAAEYLGTQTGLGRLILFFELFQYTGRMVVVVALFVIWALVAYLLLDAIGKRVTRWVPRGT
jgi:ABC-type nitrate/sulfonate/bicarbonate transport system permease component